MRSGRSIRELQERKTHRYENGGGRSCWTNGRCSRGKSEASPTVMAGVWYHDKRRRQRAGRTWHSATYSGSGGHWRRVETQWERNGGAGQSSLLRYGFTARRASARRRDRPTPPPTRPTTTRETPNTDDTDETKMDDDGALPQAAQEDDAAPQPKRTRSSRQQPTRKSLHRRPRKRAHPSAASAATTRPRQPYKRRPEGKEEAESESDGNRERGRQLLGRERRQLPQVSMHLGGGNTGTQPD